VCCAVSFSQTITVKGTVKDQNKEAAIGASVLLLNSKDSSLVKGTTTNIEGAYVLNITKGNYLLRISYLGSEDHFKNLSLQDNTDLGWIQLKQALTKLKEVVVKTDAVMATQSGDTTNYNSNAFKTNKDATAEDLITKMPGVTVVDGKVQAQGEEVKQVLVDGKPFFGDDPNSVLKNLPAEIIDKVQVFDKKSDQATFTGVDDGNTTKTINIVTKIQFRNGVFGKAYGGYGYEDKYRGGLVFNRFKEKQRFTILILSNNVNEQNFSSEDLLGVVGSSEGSGRGKRSGGSGSRSQGGTGSAESFLVDIRNGITTTNAIGMNFSDKIGKSNISAAYFFNWTQNAATSALLRQYVVGNNNGLVYAEANNASNSNMNHRFNLKLECKIDSMNSLIFQPKVSVQVNKGESELLGVNTKLETDLSRIDNNFSSDLIGYNISFPVLYRHSFTKRGRTISLNVNPSYTQSGGNNNLNNYTDYLTDSTYTDTVDQASRLDRNGLNSTTNLTYTEPLNKRNFLSANYIFTYNLSESEKNTYNLTPGGSDYTVRDSLLSNVFNTSYMANAIGATYRFQEQKYNISVGIAYQQAELYRQQHFPAAYTLSRPFTSLLPNAHFQYRFTPKKNLRVNYRANNTPPSVEQLQDVLNNSNSLQLSIGNPDLRQNFQQNLSLRYSSVNTLKSTSLFILLNGTYINDYIGNSTIVASQDTTVFNSVFLERGSQISRPVNLNNYYLLRSFINYSFPIKKIKSNLNLNGGCNYNNVPALINDKTNYSNTTSPSLGVVLSSNISEKVDFTLSSNTAYNIISNTLQTDLNTEYYSQVSKAKLTITPAKWLVFQTEYINTVNSGLSSSFNQVISLWNGAVAYKFLKDQKGELRLFVFDILNQNKSIQRTTTETYIEDTQTNILQRYFMLSFTYNFRKYYEKDHEK